MIDFTPELRAEALKILERYKWEETLFSPPIAGDAKGLLGAVQVGNTLGGTNWPGGGYDPETHTVYVMASNAGVSAYSVVTRPELGDGLYVSGVAKRQGGGGGGLNVQNLPIVKPPYGVAGGDRSRQGRAEVAACRTARRLMSSATTPR